MTGKLLESSEYFIHVDWEAEIIRTYLAIIYSGTNGNAFLHLDMHGITKVDQLGDFLQTSRWTQRIEDIRKARAHHDPWSVFVSAANQDNLVLARHAISLFDHPSCPLRDIPYIDYAKFEELLIRWTAAIFQHHYETCNRRTSWTDIAKVFDPALPGQKKP